VPPEARESDIRVDGNAVIGPAGRFGTRKNDGMFNVGTTTIGKFLADNPDLFSDLSPSLPRVMRAVSENEGKLEAVNSYDNAFMSFGIFQWTAGAESDPGELAGFLDLLKTNHAGAFQTYFGANGIDSKVGAPKPGVLRTGFVTLNGQTLDAPGRKAALRKPIWGYHFWRAGHDRDVRACEIELAMGRIDVFYAKPSDLLKGKSIKDFITSEYGVALLLDQHVNRPGHVPKTVAGAINAFAAKPGKGNPANWTTDDEKNVLKAYLMARAGTSMTNSDKRAESIKDAVDAGQLSEERGSFVASGTQNV
jgi:hypothetical protein